ncbi:serine protease [Virgibacillus indicus]|uniref:Serine protease n=1 Tax=Virgibacillus indicus TaxID=2024554 RepID=A0A265N871_9BACI|nr:CAP-associated domain-containing protein [Virgibacillus indicus]OZU88001.1 serine protease [Virgibacillus indicus]
MRKLRNIIIILFIAFAFWHFYGDTFQRSGVQGVVQDMESTVNDIKENPNVAAAIDTLNQEIQLLFGKLKDFGSDSDEPNHPVAEKPELDEPAEQSFSVHNVEIGDERSDVGDQAGEPMHTTLNEYGVDWVTYHENYQNFFMAAYDEKDQVVGLYTNQDLLTSTKGISFADTRDSVLSALNEEPLEAIRKGFVNYQIQSNQEYDVFLIDNNYVTIFYDKHENNTITAIQMISGELEQEKKNYFSEPSEELKEGFEHQLFDLTNAARVEHGLSVLSWEENLRKTVRDHSADMAENNFFSHTNQEGQSPFDRMKEDDIVSRMAGENLAASQLSSIFAHEGLMNSLGHRENILKEEYEALAVGVAFNSDSQPFYTVNFLTK